MFIHTKGVRYSCNKIKEEVKLLKLFENQGQQKQRINCAELHINGLKVTSDNEKLNLNRCEKEKH